MLCVGDPSTTDASSRLPFTRFEIDECAKAFRGRSIELSGDRATSQAIFADLTRSSHVHFSCHGQFVPGDPLNSAVIVAGGEHLRVKNLLGSRSALGVRLAVLSACQTALSDALRLPQEALGLPVGFLDAGVAGVIGSLWPVTDLSTALLMKRFYELQSGGEGHTYQPVEALRLAQIWLRGVTNSEIVRLLMECEARAEASGTEDVTVLQVIRRFASYPASGRPFADPKYWAAFALYGF
jgi:CHAT domain-containing protein